MPTSDSVVDLLVDTSAAVALVVSDHDHHDLVFAALGDADLGLSGHAAFETFSVLTRLPSPLRRTPTSASRLLTDNFPSTKFLSTAATDDLLGRLARLGIAGGRVYDALVGATAAGHALPLATRDRRALDIYQRLDVEVRLIV